MELDNLDVAKAISDLIAKQQEDLAEHIEAKAIPPDGALCSSAHDAQFLRRYTDPGDYNELQENEIRAQISQFNHYAEAGDPTYDPSGMYLCKTCVYRMGKDQDAQPAQCSIVQGEITLRSGSCDLYRHGDPMDARVFGPDEPKVTKEKAGYQERPVAKAFGCTRCQYGTIAKFADHTGRVMWCTAFGLHVQPLACCSSEEGRDSIKTFTD